MKKLTFAILGLGNRGTVYCNQLIKHSETAQIVAVAEKRKERIDSLREKLPHSNLSVFRSAEELLASERLADVLIVATQDSQHYEHAMAALKKGYHLLLEKPASNNPKECKEIAETANRYHCRILICHVLRYTPFYSRIKELLEKGTVGKIESIQADEQVGYYHYAHSYVRGNWHNSRTSSPMILAKCSHDMDLILWLTGKNCRKVSSFGSLDHFKAENAPEGATERCKDCPVKCPYHAQTFYLSRIPDWPTHILHPHPTEENIRDVLDQTDYGKCVYRMDNDVVDHQIVNLLLEDGITVNFQMFCFSNQGTRWIRIVGTQGEIWGDFKSNRVFWRLFGEEKEHLEDLNSPERDFQGHGGGDEGLIRSAIRFFREDSPFDADDAQVNHQAVESHFMAFAAEKSRLREGEVVDLDSYVRSV